MENKITHDIVHTALFLFFGFLSVTSFTLAIKMYLHRLLPERIALGLSIDLKTNTWKATETIFRDLF